MNRSTRASSRSKRSPAPNVSVATRPTPGARARAHGQRDDAQPRPAAAMSVGAAGAGPHAVELRERSGRRGGDATADARVTVASPGHAAATASHSVATIRAVAGGVRQGGRIRATIGRTLPRLPQTRRPHRGPLRTEPPDPWPDRPARQRPRGRRPPDDQPPRPGVRRRCSRRILDGMKPYFGTTNDIAMLSCAGSGGLEAAVVNTLSPGDRVLGVSHRLVRRPVREDRQDLRRGRDQARRRVGLRRRRGRGPRASSARCPTRRPSC